MEASAAQRARLEGEVADEIARLPLDLPAPAKEARVVSGDVAGGNGSTEDVAVGAPGGEIGEIDEAEAERVAAAELADKAEAEMVAAARAVDASLAQAAAVEVADAPTGLDVDDPVVDDDDEEEEEGELLDGGGDATLHSGAVPLGEW